jgi:predicted nucleotidyltransferase
MMERKSLSAARAFKRLLAKKLGPAQVIVFGSRARGDNQPDSDLDLCVIVERMNRRTREIIFDCAWEAGFSAGLVVVPVIFSREEIAGVMGESLLYQTVEREGIRL